MNPRTQLNQPRQQCLTLLEVLEALTYALEALITDHYQHRHYHSHHLERIQTIRTELRTLTLAIRWHPEPKRDQ